MVCYFGIDENEDLSMFWDDYPESPKRKRPKDFNMNYTNFEMSLALDRENEPDQFLCYRGWRFPAL